MNRKKLPLLLVLFGVVAGLLAFTPGLRAAPLPQNTQAAAFPMGVDITGQILELADPGEQRLADDLVRLNVAWVRFEFKATDPTNLQKYDSAIGKLQSRGLRIMAVLADPWATCHTDIREKDPEVFARWVRQVFLKGCGVDGPGTVHQLGFDELTARYPFIQYWQIWNEPNVCGFLQSDLDACGYGLWRRDMPGGDRVGVRWGMQKFGALLATVYAERANKQVKIISGGVLNAYNCAPQYDPVCNTDSNRGPDNCYALQPWENYACDAGVNLLVNSDAVQRFKRENNRLPFDILGLHPYQPFAWANGYVPPGQYVTQDVARNVRRFVDSSYPIWITEWSFDLATNTNQPPACRFPVTSSDRKGCEANVAALLESLVAGINARPDVNIANFFWYNLADDNTRIQAGLMDQFSRKRPSWTSFEAVARDSGPVSQRAFQLEIVGTLLRQASTAVARIG